jgi:hypothetical protein
MKNLALISQRVKLNGIATLDKLFEINSLYQKITPIPNSRVNFDLNHNRRQSKKSTNYLRNDSFG